MKSFWKKIHQKTAVALVASMLSTSVFPMSGLAAVYGVNGIFSDVAEADLSEYLATASVAASVTGNNKIVLSDGSGTGEAMLTVGYDIDVKEVSLATPDSATPDSATPDSATPDSATASNADWSETKEEIKKEIKDEILRNLSMTATVSDASPEIKDYVYLNLDKMNSDCMVTVGVKVPEEVLQSLADETYSITLEFAPELDGDLEGNIVINSLSSQPVDVTVEKGGVNPEKPLKESTVKLKGFHPDDKDGSTWIYVKDKPVDLNDYCVTDPAGLAVEFTSEDPTVATVSDAGILMPLSNGTTTVTATVVAEGYEESTAEMTVEVWTYEDMPEMPDAFELYEGEERQFTFANPLDKKEVGILDMEDNPVDESKVEVKLSNKGKTLTVIAKQAGSYRLKLVQHDKGQDKYVTYVGLVDFSVKPSREAAFYIGGFHEEKDDAEGVTTTWTYIDDGRRNLMNYCYTSAENATITFASTDESIARVEDGYLTAYGTGRITITATMKAPGYRTVTDTLIVDVWKYEWVYNLPEEITMNEGETWSRTFAKPLGNRTRIQVFNEETGELVDESILEVSLSEDRTALTVKAKQAGNYYLQTERHKAEEYTTYVEWMDITVLKEGVSLNIPVSQVAVEPDQSVALDVAYTPGSAKLEFDYDEEFMDVVYKGGKIIIKGLLPTEDGPERLTVRLLKKDGEEIASQVIWVIVAEKQLEATTVEKALSEANDKIREAIENGSYAEVYKIVDEVVKILADAPQKEIAANIAELERLEEALSEMAFVDAEIYGEYIRISATGALVNLVAMRERKGTLAVQQIEDAANRAGVTLDIKFQRGSNGENITKLAVPMQLRIKVSGIDLTKNIRIKHTKEDGSVNWIYPDVDGEYLVFWVDAYSTFAISNYTSGSGGSGGGGGGGSSTSVSVSGTVTSDAKKGYVNSITGIITGSAAGYSRWSQDETGWKLQYADGTFAAGVMMTDENGNPYEQVAWELINGAWYPFGADGYVKSGFVYDVALGGTFYVDINTGMKTGWQLIDGVWRYFNTVSDGKRGIMLTDTTVDGYYIDAEGIWRQ